MGQAQLLLIVLGVVLVGIAIVAGIQAYTQNNQKSSVDALTHDALRMASDAQTWAQKPVQFGGPTTYADLTQVTTAKIGYPAAPTINANGQCGIKSAGASDVRIVCQNNTLKTLVEVKVAGLSDADISVVQQVVSGATANSTWI